MPFPRYKLWLALGALSGCLAVVLGAFGAHGLERALADDSQLADKLANWETAARYQMYHALALLAVGLLGSCRCGLAVNLAGTAMTLGTLIFSGCLYAYVLGGPTWLGKIVPIGGTLMIVGWLALLVAVVRHEDTDRAKTSP